MVVCFLGGGSYKALTEQLGYWGIAPHAPSLTQGEWMPDFIGFPGSNPGSLLFPPSSQFSAVVVLFLIPYKSPPILTFEAMCELLNYVCLVVTARGVPSEGVQP